MSQPSWATLVRAPNPSPMTLDGTNTWVLRAPGESGCVVVDPGPLHEEHLAAVAAHAPVLATLLTHGHPDHAEGAARFHELTGAPVLAFDPAYVIGDDRLAPDRGPLVLAGVEVRTFTTPGHTADSVSFAVQMRPQGSHLNRDPEPAVLTGDTILGRGTTVVAWPDGELGDYLHSLERLRGLGPIPVLPGHGPVLPDAGEIAAAYLEHRRVRLDQVRAAVDAGDRTPAEVVARVYADVDRAVWPAAELSVRAQLAYLDRAP
jgi:glyoxylase-like metal-dependent hydrolase (beta-lactamase superfamily II)